MFTYVSGGVALALALTMAGSPSQAPSQAGSQGGSQAGTLTVHREYGQGPVIVPGGADSVRLTFHGKKGDIVLVDAYPAYVPPCVGQSLRGTGGTVDPWYGGVWRLPASGRYTFVYHRCITTAMGRLQLVRATIRPVPVNGAPVVLRIGKNGAYEDLASVKVPKHGRVQVRPTKTGVRNDWDAVYVKGAARKNLVEWHQDRAMSSVYLEGGAPVSNELGAVDEQDATLVPRAGERVLLAPGQARVRVNATRTAPVPASLDGPAVRVKAQHPFQEVGALFTADGGQWVRASVTGSLATRSLAGLALVDATGRPLIGLNQSTNGGGPALWYLPMAGEYRMMVRTDPDHVAGRIRLFSVRELDGQLTTDGQPLAVTPQLPGEAVVVRTSVLNEAPYSLTTETTGSSDWTGFAAPVPAVLCRSTFCDQPYGSAFLLPGGAPSRLQAAGPWVVFVDLAAGQTGTVTLRLAPTT